MKFNPFLITRLFLMLGTLAMLSSCIKNDNFIEGDSKIKFYNVVSGLPQDFYLDGNRISTSLSYGSNSDYMVVEGKKMYNILAKNTGTQDIGDSIRANLAIGYNYSVFYTKNKAMDSLLVFYQDSLKIDTARSKFRIINLGYTLKSKVMVRDSAGSFQRILDYAEQSNYISLRFENKNKLYFNLVDSANVVDTLKANGFLKGKVYTILIDGAKSGKLQERLIPNN